MERMGLVSRVAEDLEQVISQGRLPRDGRLPSEQLLSKQYGVSRTTVREALSQLAARGLIVQYPGRRSRAVALDEAVTLENLGVALHGEGPAHPERRRLLEGFLALKRELTVELLAACCEHASKSELERLTDACFALRDAARWEEERGRWVAWEFELMRRAASLADRPGHLMLIHSLERSYWGMRGRVLPHLDSASVCRWAECALYALVEKDAQALRRDLPPLLKASDERLLSSRGLATKKVDTSEAPPANTLGFEAPTSEVLASESFPLEEPTSDEAPASEILDSEVLTSEVLTSEVLTSEVLTSEVLTSEVLTSEVLTSEVPTSAGPSSEGPPSASTAAAAPSAGSTPAATPAVVEAPRRENSAPESAGGEALAGAVFPHRSDCRTGLCEMRPAGAPSPEAGAIGACQPVGRTTVEGDWPSDHGAAREVQPPLASLPEVEPQGESSAGESRALVRAPLPLLRTGVAEPPERE